MKFLCDQCKTRYTISDEKVRGKVLKIRCKNCSNVIEVREPSTGPPRPAPQKRPTSTGAAKAKRRHGSQVARLKSSTGQRLVPAPKSGAATKRPEPGRLGAGARATKRPVAPRKESTSRPRPTPAAPQGETEQKTVIAAMPQELLQDARSRAQIRRTSKSLGGSGRAAPVADEPADWYLGDDRGEYGPMTFSELAARVKRGEPGPNAEAWQEGMDDWRPLEEIQELQPYLKKAPPPRPTAQVAKAAPPSPLQKRPGRDPMAVGVSAPVPAAPKQRSPTAEIAEPLVKPPASVPALTPTPASEDPWPVLPEHRSGPAVASLGAAPVPAATPVPSGSESQLGGSAAHVSAAGASDLGTLLEQQRKRDRRPILIISVAAVFIAALAVALVIYLISSGKKSGKESSGTEVAQKDMEHKAPMGEPARGAGMDEAMARAAAPMEYDLSELDIEIDVSKGKNKGMSNGRRHAGGMAPRPRPRRHAARPSSSDTADPIALPGMRPKFVGLMSFGAPRPSSGSFGGGGGARPGNLRQVVRRNYNRLKRCYEKAARINSRIRNPRLRIFIRVSSSGKVRSVSVSPQKYAADTLGICIRRSIGGWRFPSFSSKYTYSFSARFSEG